MSSMKLVILFRSVSEDYESAFTEKNYKVIFVEPLQFTFINTDKLNESLRQDYDGLILTSPRAIEAVSNCWDPSKLAIWTKRKIYTVGDVSMNKITMQLGMTALGATSGNAENLARMVIKDNPKSSKFLFPCGNLRSETLPNLLQTAEIGLEAITVYETKENENLQQELIQLNNLRSGPCCVVFFSPSGCEYVYRQLQTMNSKLASVPHFAIGNTTAHKIGNFGIDVAGVATKPKADSIVEAVEKYFASF